MTPTDDEIRAPIARVLMQVAELPDRSSPEDWPEAMLVTTEELGAIIRDKFGPLAEEVLRLRAENKQLLAGLELICHDQLLVSRAGHGPFFVQPDHGREPAIGDYAFNVMCSDTFAWACADSEGIAMSQAPEILALYRAGGWQAVAKWVQEKRGGPDKEKFIRPVSDMISSDEALRAENAKMRALLVDAKEAIQHGECCNAQIGDESDCDCGTRELRQRISEVTT